MGVVYCVFLSSSTAPVFLRFQHSRRAFLQAEFPYLLLGIGAEKGLTQLRKKPSGSSLGTSTVKDRKVVGRLS